MFHMKHFTRKAVKSFLVFPGYSRRLNEKRKKDMFISVKQMKVMENGIHTINNSSSYLSDEAQSSLDELSSLCTTIRHNYENEKSKALKRYYEELKANDN